MQPAIEALPDKSALIERARALVVEKVQAAIAQRGRCTLALAGGSTPKPLYEALAQADLPNDQLYLFWGDERYVPADHPDSNAKMVRESWLERVDIPTENVFSVPTEAPSPAEAAHQYEQTLQQFFQTDGLPQFDVILLGMGDDGHTASLFPQTPVLQIQDRWVAVGEKANQPRITLTAPLINQARNVIFLVSGANKQTALSQVFSPHADALTYPARLIRPAGNLYWLLDAAAAAGLPAQIDFEGTGE
ncbi:MAG: 6-phosphogluconolactonase [Leptolyngbya sp. SIO4C1]|nr:6-phosphogluconolactonase [Leptolyngbya sp. SIO4C1]